MRGALNQSNKYFHSSTSLDKEAKNQNVPKNEISFRWSHDMKHEGVEILSEQRIAKAKNDHFENRLVLA